MSAEPAYEPDMLSADVLFRDHPQPLWLVDVSSLRLLDVNRAALESYRLERPAFLSRTLPEMWVATPPRLTAATSDPEVLAGAVSGRAVHRRGDGSTFAVQLTARPASTDGRTALLVSVSPDAGAAEADGGDGLLEALLEVGSEAVLVLDAERRITGANHRAAVLLGAEAGRLPGLEAERLFPADDVLTPTLLRSAAGQPLRAEVTLQRLDGGRVPAELTLRPLRSGGAALLLSDVTMKRTAERSLARSERRFRALIQHSNDVIVVLDARGRLIYQSPSASKLGFDGAAAETGRPRAAGDGDLEDAATGADAAGPGIDLSKGVHPRDRRAVQGALTRLVEDGGTQTVTFRFRAAKRWRWLEVVASNRLDDPNVGGLVLNVRDVTERVEAVARLRESEATYRALFEKGMEGVLLIEPDRRVRVASGPALRLLGYAPRDLLGREHSDLIHEDDRDAFLDMLDLVEAKAGSSESVRFRLRDPGGGWRWLEGTVTNLEDDADVGAIVLNFREITDRVRAMEKISDLNAELRRRVAHLQSLRRIDMAITNSVDLRLVLDIFVDQVLADMEVDAVAVLLFDEVASEISAFAGRGFEGALEPGTRTRLGAGPAGRSALEQRTVYVPDLKAEDVHGAAVAPERQDGFVSYL
ncbi:MAG TPA: PAS domain-containing protein, partial [Trueperaceae bacterium]|nr:PAS domain-containing protein [Trueperaceae bacterium]